jgi:hypothetical protein
LFNASQTTCLGAGIWASPCISILSVPLEISGIAQLGWRIFVTIHQHMSPDTMIQSPLILLSPIF